MSKLVFFYLIVCTLYGFTITYFFFDKRPYHIALENNLTCEVTGNTKKYANYIFERYGKEGNFNKINAALLNHGFFLRNESDSNLIYISYGDGNVCLGRFLIWDSQIIYMKRDHNSKVTSLEG